MRLRLTTTGNSQTWTFCDYTGWVTVHSRQRLIVVAGGPVLKFRGPRRKWSSLISDFPLYTVYITLDDGVCIVAAPCRSRTWRSRCRSVRRRAPSARSTWTATNTRPRSAAAATRSLSTSSRSAGTSSSFRAATRPTTAPATARSSTTSSSRTRTSSSSRGSAISRRRPPWPRPEAPAAARAARRGASRPSRCSTTTTIWTSSTGTCPAWSSSSVAAPSRLVPFTPRSARHSVMMTDLFPPLPRPPAFGCEMHHPSEIATMLNDDGAVTNDVAAANREWCINGLISWA